MIKQEERNMVRKLLNKIEYKTSRVEALSASKSKLIQGSTVARKELLSLAQNEKEIGPTKDKKGQAQTRYIHSDPLFPPVGYATYTQG